MRPFGRLATLRKTETQIEFFTIPTTQIITEIEKLKVWKVNTVTEWIPSQTLFRTSPFVSYEKKLEIRICLHLVE